MLCCVEAHNNLGVLQRDVGAIPDALASYERALQLVPDSRNAGQNRLLALNYIYPGEDGAVCAAHVEWGAAFQAQFAQHVLPEVLPTQRNTAPGRPLRVRSCFHCCVFVCTLLPVCDLSVFACTAEPFWCVV
jgi:hypothetical protein